MAPRPIPRSAKDDHGPPGFDYARQQQPQQQQAGPEWRLQQQQQGDGSSPL